ncbi:MAG: type I-F CRISPR-associated helicase Cas3f [Thiotrichales bacterium]
MMVTFVSQCEKKALPKTRRVLDAFANRIGDRTWQTVITKEGLQAVRKLLRKTASKNTAVSCHWMRSRSRTELVWIVGNRNKFNAEGMIPVNSTKKTVINTDWEDDWHYLPLIKALTGLAALFHDWGKASEFFQWKLLEKGIIGDPIRHEWISLLFFSLYAQDQSDDIWLENMANGEFDLEAIKVKLQSHTRPFKNLPNAAITVAWLIVSHHRLPLDRAASAGSAPNDIQRFLKRINQQWNYQNKHDDYEQNVKRCFDYPKGLPTDSKVWLKAVKKQARKLKDALPLLEKALADGSWRAIVQHCRLCLMLGDHYYSSLEPSSPKRLKQKELELLANTDKNKQPKQSLDEHLLGVAKQALRNAHFLPFFEGKSMNGEVILQEAENVKALKVRSTHPDFIWQDKAVSAIKAWRKKEGLAENNHFGFFAVNMASTGKGKTFANAKIMQALSTHGDSLRYVLALGLRTLTLQTGDEYRERIKLGKEDLAVLIGSKAVLELHNKNKSQAAKSVEEAPTGSESEERLLDNELEFDPLPYVDEQLTTVLHTAKERQFLYAPVLACTIDHLMAATETKRGGRYILPTLRLMYSDLVIDEIDDFDGKDLIAIGRLIHLAGMLGRKVMISSATIPPDMAEGYFNVYQAGWNIFAKLRDKKATVGCAWIDEFKTQVHSVNCLEAPDAIARYQAAHTGFIEKRLRSLGKQVVKRKAEIVPLERPKQVDETTLHDMLYHCVQQAIIRQHQLHATIDKKTGKQISFGVVRIANIPPCIELTRYLLNAEWGDEYAIRTMAYHSQQVLIMRNEQEKHLDEVLKRKQGKQASFDHPLIRQHLENTEAKNLIFILVATPVEEVGRDHDFDWAVVEPSSFRSIIQLAGRVLRHQNLQEDIAEPNIAVLQYNRKGILKKEVAFARPGYESKTLRLATKDLQQLLDTKQLAKALDASPRIVRSKNPDPENNLADLEHEAIHRLLSDYKANHAGSMQAWLDSNWWLTAIPQELVKFRESSPVRTLYLSQISEEFKFVEKDKFGKATGSVEYECGITHDDSLNELEKQRLWLERDYEALLQATEKPSLEIAAMTFGELNLPVYGEESTAKFTYSSHLGLMKR